MLPLAFINNWLTNCMQYAYIFIYIACEMQTQHNLKQLLSSAPTIVSCYQCHIKYLLFQFLFDFRFRYEKEMVVFSWIITAFTVSFVIIHSSRYNLVSFSSELKLNWLCWFQSWLLISDYTLYYTHMYSNDWNIFARNTKSFMHFWTIRRWF